MLVTLNLGRAVRRRQIGRNRLLIREDLDDRRVLAVDANQPGRRRDGDRCFGHASFRCHCLYFSLVGISGYGNAVFVTRNGTSESFSRRAGLVAE